MGSNGNLVKRERSGSTLAYGCVEVIPTAVICCAKMSCSSGLELTGRLTDIDVVIHPIVG
jgi:hypothetical protein